MNERMYHVFVHNVKTKTKYRTTVKPVTREEGLALLAKVTPYSWRRTELEEVLPEPVH